MSNRTAKHKKTKQKDSTALKTQYPWMDSDMSIAIMLQRPSVRPVFPPNDVDELPETSHVKLIQLFDTALINLNSTSWSFTPTTKCRNHHVSITQKLKHSAHRPVFTSFNSVRTLKVNNITCLGYVTKMF